MMNQKTLMIVAGVGGLLLLGVAVDKAAAQARRAAAPARSGYNPFILGQISAVPAAPAAPVAVVPAPAVRPLPAVASPIRAPRRAAPSSDFRPVPPLTPVGPRMPVVPTAP